MKFATYSGRLIDIENFTVDDVDLEDIAHSLAKIQRFNGNLPINVSYTVGEHSINLARHMYLIGGIKHEFKARYALLHDATEAYMSDLLSPVKNAIPEYKELENEVQYEILKRFNIGDEDYFKYLITDCFYRVYQADKRMMMDEVETIMPDKYKLYQKETGLQKLGCHIMYNNHPSTVKQCFLTMARNLGIE